MNTWIALITSLPTENATARMRAWRSLKASGAAVLRDGVYLMPERGDCQNTLDTVAADVRAADGTALVVRLEEPTDGNFVALFDRSADFANLLGDIATAREGLSPDTANESLKQVRKLRKAFGNLAAIDFFPGE
ncbi:MAG: chromate resistance protein, partial [Methylobacillus glycogenes]|nr:chromate resistance protein [Methylobacillus glycogenes]